MTGQEIYINHFADLISKSQALEKESKVLGELLFIFMEKRLRLLKSKKGYVVFTVSENGEHNGYVLEVKKYLGDIIIKFYELKEYTKGDVSVWKLRDKPEPIVPIPLIDTRKEFQEKYYSRFKNQKKCLHKNPH